MKADDPGRTIRYSLQETYVLQGKIIVIHLRRRVTDNGLALAEVKLCIRTVYTPVLTGEKLHFVSAKNDNFRLALTCI